AVMLNLGRIKTHDCQAVSRRALLQAGACSALGLGLPHWLAEASAAPQRRAPVKSVLLLWLWGGPSHHEMWDPKPHAPASIRGSYRPIATASSGMNLGELLPNCARASERFAIVRSMSHEMKDHNQGGTVALTGSTNGSTASGAAPFPGRVRPSLGSL